MSRRGWLFGIRSRSISSTIDRLRGSPAGPTGGGGGALGLGRRRWRRRLGWRRRGVERDVDVGRSARRGAPLPSRSRSRVAAEADAIGAGLHAGEVHLPAARSCRRCDPTRRVPPRGRRAAWRPAGSVTVIAMPARAGAAAGRRAAGAGAAARLASAPARARRASAPAAGVAAEPAPAPARRSRSIASRADRSRDRSRASSRV